MHGDDYQIVLVDLPGFQKPFDALTRRMQRSVDDGLRDVDAVLLVLDASEVSGGGDRFIAEQLAATGAPVVIALNKVDRLKPAGDPRGDRGRLRAASATTWRCIP